MGPAGATGATGAPGAAASTTVTTGSSTGTTTTVTATCSSGKAVGGGYAFDPGQGSASGNVVLSSRPAQLTGQPTGWTVVQSKTNPLTVYVTCIP